MDAPKPPFRLVTEELLYSIFLKINGSMNGLQIEDINTLAKLNFILTDADLMKAEDIIAALNAVKGNVPDAGNSLGKLYGIIQALNYLKREDIDTLAEINSLLIDADLVKTEDLTQAIASIENEKEIQFYFHSRGGDDDHDNCCDRDRFLLKGRITNLNNDCSNELSGVTYKSRLDTSSSWIAHATLISLQSWIEVNVNGNHQTGTQYWIKCIPVYKPGKYGEAVNLFGYTLA